MQHHHKLATALIIGAILAGLIFLAYQGYKTATGPFEEYDGSWRGSNEKDLRGHKKLNTGLKPANIQELKERSLKHGHRDNE
jgi:hypothetical protein